MHLHHLQGVSSFYMAKVKKVYSFPGFRLNYIIRIYDPPYDICKLYIPPISFSFIQSSYQYFVKFTDYEVTITQTFLQSRFISFPLRLNFLLTDAFFLHSSPNGKDHVSEAHRNSITMVVKNAWSWVVYMYQVIIQNVNYLPFSEVDCFHRNHRNNKSCLTISRITSSFYEF
jgi:hypothetical protein